MYGPVSTMTSSVSAASTSGSTSPSMSHTYQDTRPEPGMFGFCDWYGACAGMQPPFAVDASFTQRGSVLHGCVFPVPLNLTSTTPRSVVRACGSWYEPDHVPASASMLNPNVALPVIGASCDGIDPPPVAVQPVATSANGTTTTRARR